MGTTKMGSDSTSKPTPTAEETAMNQAQLKQFQAYEPQQTEMFKSAFGMGNQLLNSFGNPQGQQWQSLIGGVTDEQQQRMITEQDRYLKPQFQEQGIYDSGMAATARMRSATDLANQNAQFNVGTLQNALNLALSGQAQIQQPALGQSTALMGQLAGLRTQTVSQRGFQTQSPFSMIMQAGQLGVNAFSAVKCWVAAEIFNEPMDGPRVNMVRYYMNNIAPKWLDRLYTKYGKNIAKFIHNKPIFKLMLRPLFEYFIYQGSKVIVGGLI